MRTYVKNSSMGIYTYIYILYLQERVTVPRATKHLGIVKNLQHRGLVSSIEVFRSQGGLVRRIEV